MRSFPLKISAPEGVKYDAPAESLLVKCAEGDIEILAGHADFIGTVTTGRARITEVGGKARLASISGGFITVCGGEITVAAATFEYADEIDIERARRAKDDAERALRNATTDLETKKAQHKLMRAINRIKVYELK